MLSKQRFNLHSMFDRHGRRSQHVFLKIRPDDPCQRRLIHLDLNCEVDLICICQSMQLQRLSDFK